MQNRLPMGSTGKRFEDFHAQVLRIDGLNGTCESRRFSWTIRIRSNGTPCSITSILSLLIE